jgi:hypothetical protein
MRQTSIKEFFAKQSPLAPEGDPPPHPPRKRPRIGPTGDASAPSGYSPLTDEEKKRIRLLPSYTGKQNLIVLDGFLYTKKSSGYFHTWICRRMPNKKLENCCAMLAGPTDDPSGVIWKRHLEHCHAKDEDLIKMLEDRATVPAEASTSRCGTYGCQTCPMIDPSPLFGSPENGGPYRINRNNNCSSNMLVYLLTNQKTGHRYVGQTTHSLKDRLTWHRRDAKTENTWLYREIRENGMDAFRVQVIDGGTDQQELRDKETAWIGRLKTLYPGGLNSL